MKEDYTLETLRHSASHIMAHAVVNLFPQTKLAIGPPIEDGFYYDFDSSVRFSDADLEKIEQKMNEIIKSDYKFIRIEVKKEEALKIFRDRGEKYKIEILQEITDDTVTLYESGDFLDLCKGPHVPSTGYVKYFKLLKIAGAYWRGDESREQLQRIYGTAFFTEEELLEYLKTLEEAKKRDHRKLGKELNIFEIYDEFGSGLILWLPKGAIIRKIIEDYWIDLHQKNNYLPVITPHIAKIDLWKTSGHTEFYSDYMYSPIKIDNQEYLLKPMNCPGHILIYKSRLHSYRDLPVRYCELGTVYRYERSGVLHGLLRVRGFTQDDAHIFCMPTQIESEIINVLNLTVSLLEDFGFKEYEIRLSTRPEKFVGEIQIWEHAENSLKEALERLNLPYKIDPTEGVFYGPKIDIKIKDCLKRSWQCSTIQLDFNLPQKFNVTFKNKQSQDENVVMIHRALMGSLERFIGVLIEHYAGRLPIWLAPLQVKILTISKEQIKYAKEINEKLSNIKLRCELDISDERLDYKLRNAILEKIPYMIILGKREQDTKKISVRKYDTDLGSMELTTFIQKIQSEISNKSV